MSCGAGHALVDGQGVALADHVIVVIVIREDNAGQGNVAGVGDQIIVGHHSRSGEAGGDRRLLDR